MKQVFAMAVFLSASPLAAQQVVSVQSGEHEGYSRLVLRIDPSVDWQVNTRPGVTTIRFPEQTLNFDTSRVFDRISTARIAGVKATQLESGAELQLELDCKCDVQSFAFDGNYIVIDVYDGPELDAVAQADLAAPWQPDGLPFIQPSNAPLRFATRVMLEAPRQPQLMPDPMPQDKAAASVPETAMLAPPDAPDTVVVIEGSAVEMATEPKQNMLAGMADMTGAVMAEMNETVQAKDDPEMLARIEEAQNQLLAQLTRAADQGLVNFVPAPVVVVEQMPEPAPEPAPEDPELMLQLSARTAYSQGTEDALTEIVNQFAMPQCLDDAAFTMEGWGGETGFSARLAELRSSLLGEFDVPDAEITQSIVQLYLRYGFGAEARLIMNETDVELENALIYSDMAALLEGEPERVSGPVLKGAGCGGAHEMWYLAAGLGGYQVLEPLTITDTFSSYPIEVRALIGPPLAQSFIDRGQVDAGHLVLEIVRRAESGVTPAQRMAEARVLEAQGDLPAAAEIYRALALENGELAPKALVAYARTLLTTGTPLPETLLVDLEAAAFFNRNTDFADPLRLSEIRARAEIAGVNAALAQIAETMDERPDISGALRQITADIFTTSTAEDLGDYPYAQMVLRYADMLEQGPLGDAARLKIAEEMAAIGLPETALDVLTPNLARPSTRATQIEAAAFVQLFQPSQALVVLAGDESLAGYKIRLNAYLQMEDFAAVARLLNQAYASDISLNDVALRAGDWAKIQDAGALGALALYVQGADNPDASAPPAQALPPMMADESPSLRAARELLANNQQSMQFLEDVLAEGQ